MYNALPQRLILRQIRMDSVPGQTIKQSGIAHLQIVGLGVSRPPRECPINQTPPQRRQ